MVSREELFERERHSEPVPGWHSCELAVRSSLNDFPQVNGNVHEN
jgi:hypothetical protein